jgi:hypothetical protein
MPNPVILPHHIHHNRGNGDGFLIYYEAKSYEEFLRLKRNEPQRDCRGLGLVFLGILVIIGITIWWNRRFPSI